MGVSKVGGEQTLQVFLGHALAMGQVVHLVVPDAADIEIRGLGVRQVKTADAGRGCHGHALGERHANVLALQQLEHGAFHAVVWTRGVAWCRADALVLLFDQFFVAQGF